MPGRVDGKVAFITGAGRGQGRSHAARLAEEGADIIAVDLLADYDTIPYGMATQEDLDQTVAEVTKFGRRIIAAKADVRDLKALRDVLERGVAEFGHLDIVVANAGICSSQTWDEVTPELWQDTIDTNLTGPWNTMVASVPYLISNGGGSIICTASTAATKGFPWCTPYVAAKHGLLGVARSLANELASKHIRVNTVHPTGVDTAMVAGISSMADLIARDPSLGPLYMNTYPVTLIDPVDVSNAVLFLASEEARYVTGLALAVDAGNTIR